MADTPTPQPGPTQETKEVQEAFIKLFAKLGFKLEAISPQEIDRAMGPLQRFMKDFSKTADVKNTFFGKLPGIQKGLQAIIPDNMRFIRTLIEVGNASLDGADGMEFYNNSLGFFGKGLVQVTRLFHTTGEASTVFGWTVNAAMSTATLGIAAIVAILIALAQAFVTVIKLGTQWQERLNEFNRTLGGVTRERLANFNAQINEQIKTMSQYGFSLSEILSGMQSYIATGLNMAKVMKEDLVKNTLLLSEVSGQSAESLAGFFSGIIRGSKVSGDNIKALGNTWTAFNKSVEASGVLGAVSFSEVQEAITSVGTALLVASNKGKSFTDNLTRDLVSLTGLAKALNISVSDLNAKFEQASNLITGQESGFRALLAISGGANIENMLNNQFTRTDAMIKVADRLAMLNTQFGGNLSILGQVAESTFGLSKDVAIKLATMSSEQRKALVQAQQDSERLQKDSMEKSWQSVTGTLSAQFDRFKNVMASVIQRAFAGSEGVQKFINNITDTLARWISGISNPNSPVGKMIAAIGHVVDTLFSKASDLVTDLTPYIEKFGKWLEDFITAFQTGGFWGGVAHYLYEAFVMPFRMLAEVFILVVKKGLIEGGGKLTGLIFGKLTDEQSKFLANLDTSTGNMKDAASMFSTSSSKLNEKVAGLTAALKQNQEEQNRLNGLKDTDIVIGKNGEFTLAGLERLDLQDEETRLQQERDKEQKEQTQILRRIAENTETAKRNKIGIVNDTLASRHMTTGYMSAPAQRAVQQAGGLDTTWMYNPNPAPE